GNPNAGIAGTATPRRGSPSLALLPGINLLTWPGQDMSPSQALQGQAGSLKVVYEWDATAGKWKRYALNAPAFINNLPTLHQGSAYWFIATGASSIQVAD
ncbi:MAG TPA: hypothetical protein VFY90_00245, partial [Tepidiformaceae bacterium]|nr:hypothetical protein [Tepidiformaceae bacterium]